MLIVMFRAVAVVAGLGEPPALIFALFAWFGLSLVHNDLPESAQLIHHQIEQNSAGNLRLFEPENQARHDRLIQFLAYTPDRRHVCLHQLHYVQTACPSLRFL